MNPTPLHPRKVLRAAPPLHPFCRVSPRGFGAGRRSRGRWPCHRGGGLRPSLTAPPCAARGQVPVRHRRPGLRSRSKSARRSALTAWTTSREQPGSFLASVEGCGDDVEVERGEVDAGCGADAVEAAAHHAERILCSKQQYGASARDREAAQARRARGDGDVDVEREKRLAASCRAPDYAAWRWFFDDEGSGPRGIVRARPGVEQGPSGIPLTWPRPQGSRAPVAAPMPCCRVTSRVRRRSGRSCYGTLA